MGDNPDRTWVADYRPQLRISEVGKLVAIGDGIARIEGLPSAAMDEILRFEDGSEALVFDLGSKRIGAILLNQRKGLAAGSSAHLTGRRLDIGVGDGFLGRVVDPLGHPLDGGLPVEFSRRRALEVSSPPITARDFVERPLLSGNKMVDTMIPIGKGQRQSIIGDAGTKSSRKRAMPKDPRQRRRSGLDRDRDGPSCCRRQGIRTKRHRFDTSKTDRNHR